MRFHEGWLRLHPVGIRAAVSLIWFSRNSVDQTTGDPQGKNFTSFFGARTYADRELPFGRSFLITHGSAIMWPVAGGNCSNVAKLGRCLNRKSFVPRPSVSRSTSFIMLRM